MLNDNTSAVAVDAPIPGQSLTAPLGGRPWQKPPQYSTPEEALAFYVERITEDKQTDQIMDLLEIGVPADTLVDTMTLGGVMQGLHSADVSMIIGPALIETISGMATKAGIDHKVVAGDGELENKPTRSEIAVVLNKEKQKPNSTMAQPAEEMEEEQETSEPLRGLMARRV